MLEEIWWVAIWSLFDWWREYRLNPAVMGKSTAPKFSSPIRLLDFFTQNFSRKALSFEYIFCMAVYHYDWNLMNKILVTDNFWSSFKVVPWSQAQVQNTILPSICRNKLYIYIYIYKLYIYIYIFNSFFTFDNNLHTVQASDARWKICKLAFIFLLKYSKNPGVLTDISLLIVSLFEKHNGLFSYSILCFTTKN